ncbi:TonB-dependent receptor [Crocinitomix catalasitica]|uniref:TonB-dependent receptor n=1 Tax=Crocinitomix catalasitica TaxID=184607 RepID=UPI000480FD73|nr:TonB-dependent receptor [Crocinitomix catalasitica]
MKSLILYIALLSISVGFSQNTGSIQGIVKDVNTEEPLLFAKILVEGTTEGAVTDLNGNYRLELPVGTYTLRVSFVGYEAMKKFNINVTSGNVQTVNFTLSQTSSELKSVDVVYQDDKIAKTTDMVTPLSVQKLTSIEIESNPGGNFDVSKVVQTLPGVGGSGGGAQRNDIIIRGGAPNENVYYLDGIEIPVLNHFQTQGSSGGAQGILNVSFIEDLKLSSSAFDTRYDNALASTFVITQRQGNREKISGNVRASVTESVLTLEGPMGKKNDFLVSARASYLDLLFTLLDLPIRPNFTDYQFKTTFRPNNKNSITVLGLGAYDRFNFAATKEDNDETEYLRRSLPFITQWNYTVGTAWKHRVKDGFFNLALSRNMFDNQLDQFEDARNGDEEYRNFGLQSQEIENKLRFDFNQYKNGWKYSFGGVAQYVKYNSSLYNKITQNIYDSTGTLIVPAQIIEGNSEIDFFKYGLFVQVSKNIFKDKLLVSAGVRTDMNSFTDKGNNPLETISPRLSLAYHLNNRWDITASVGSYFKIPTYTSLGYQNIAGEYVNQSLTYIRSDHYVLGAQFLPNQGLRITLEGFYKEYSNYPVSVANGVSLANQGQEFGAVGNEFVTSDGKGQTYGFEVFVQQKLVKNVFFALSYTYVRSLFSGSDGELLPSAWDSQNLLSATLGLNLGKTWKLGLKYRYSGGLPYTPWDLEASQQTYLFTGNGVLNYNDVNGSRLRDFNQMDIRIDKIVNLKKVSFDFYIDIQNILAYKQESSPYYTFQRNADNTGFASTDGNPIQADGSNAVPLIINNESRLITPTIGVIFEF